MADYTTHYRSLARQINRVEQSDDRELPLHLLRDDPSSPSSRAVHHFVARRMLSEGLIRAAEDGRSLRIHGLTDAGRRLLDAE